ncbi:MAG: ATP-dependent Clp protease adaptor ClpS [Cyclobacteriaceae bacterium]|nr:ATP-dependent Clp protease adaptor ClpS [Cyclobacteriaceae bacterium]
MSLQYQEEVLVDVLEDEDKDDPKNLIVFNDDYNTFDHVIHTLVKVCKHTYQQAEQCTWLIHYQGKCTVKTGTYRQLKPMREGICEAGIDAKIY